MRETEGEHLDSLSHPLLVGEQTTEEAGEPQSSAPTNNWKRALSFGVSKKRAFRKSAPPSTSKSAPSSLRRSSSSFPDAPLVLRALGFEPRKEQVKQMIASVDGANDTGMIDFNECVPFFYFEASVAHVLLHLQCMTLRCCCRCRDARAGSSSCCSRLEIVAEVSR